MKQTARTLRIVAALIVAGAAAVGADYKDSFRRGLQAANQRRWADAARFFQQAITEQAKETGERIVISGMDTKPYLPHFYLGLMFFNANNCAEALKAWQLSESQGAVRRNSEFDLLTRNRNTCQKQLATAEPAVVPVPVPRPDPAAVAAASNIAVTNLEKARTAARELGSLQSDLTRLQQNVWQEAELGPAQARAQTALTSAEAKYNASLARSDPAELRVASEAAVRAFQELEAVRSRALARLDELRRNVARTAESPPARPELPARGPDLSAAVVAPVSPINSAAPGPPTSRQPVAPAASSAVPGIVARESPVRLPRELVAGVRLFFNAQYQGTLDALKPLRVEAAPVAAQVYLFRAGSLYALYLVSGERDPSLARQAAENVKQCKRLDPKAAPDKRVFSPRFVRFFVDTPA